MEFSVDPVRESLNLAASGNSQNHVRGTRNAGGLLKSEDGILHMHLVLFHSFSIHLSVFSPAPVLPNKD